MHNFTCSLDTIIITIILYPQVKRDVGELRRKRTKYTSEVKAKYSRYKAELKKTGGGSVTCPSLTSIEEKVISIIGKTATEGINDGIDSYESSTSSATSRVTTPVQELEGGSSATTTVIDIPELVTAIQAEEGHQEVFHVELESSDIFSNISTGNVLVNVEGTRAPDTSASDASNTATTCTDVATPTTSRKRSSASSFQDTLLDIEREKIDLKKQLIEIEKDKLNIVKEFLHVHKELTSFLKEKI